MKAKFLLGLVLLATLGTTSCKKDKEEEPTNIKIGDKNYGIVAIDGQYWTTENYNGVGGLLTNPNAPVAGYGKLYTLAEAKAITLPAGWRIPTKEDFVKLTVAQGAEFDDNYTAHTDAIKKLMSKSGWDDGSGTNTSGFNAFPAGFMYNDEPENQGFHAAFWTSSVNNTEPYIFEIYQDGTDVLEALYWSEGSLINRRYPVRFVKDK
jgi:uncharacterized protein (TIGR02145 family)